MRRRRDEPVEVRIVNAREAALADQARRGALPACDRTIDDLRVAVGGWAGLIVVDTHGPYRPVNPVRVVNAVGDPVVVEVTVTIRPDSGAPTA